MPDPTPEEIADYVKQHDLEKHLTTALNNTIQHVIEQRSSDPPAHVMADELLKLDAEINPGKKRYLPES